MIRYKLTALSPILAAIALSGCATGDKEVAIQGLPPIDVMASGETIPVGTANADAADDPAIWVNPVDATQSLIVATDKKAGIYVYGMDGKIRSFADAGLVNNVDLVGDIVIASDRNDKANAHLAVYRLDGAAAKLTKIGRIPVAAGEAYGVCMSDRSTPDAVLVTLVMKDGNVIDGIVSTKDGKATFTETGSFKLKTQAEGCVHYGADKFVGEEDVGIWHFAAGVEPKLFAPVDNQRLVADVEGLATITYRGNDYLLASSQGDNAYAVYRLPNLDYVGRFRIAPGAIDGTYETDGIEARAGNFGPEYPEGIFIAQDGDNLPDAQNFKLVSWKAIADALGIQ